MVKFALVLSSLAIGLSGQTKDEVTCTTFGNQITCSKPTDYVSPIINAMKASSDAKIKAQQLQLQKEQVEIQREQLKLEQERQRASEQGRQQASEQQQLVEQIEMNKLLQSLRTRHPDFSLYEAKIADLANLFLPGKSVNPYEYVEGLYLIAKHAAETTHDQQ